MAGPSFDTYKLTRKLENAGFSPDQAENTSAAIAEAFAEWQGALNLATREDLKIEIKQLDTKLHERFAEVNERFAEVNERFAEINERFAQVNVRIAEKGVETIKWVVGMSLAQAGLIIGVLKAIG
jgi:hypothetical protein